MPETLKTSAMALDAVDYFRAKLQFESTPHQLHELLRKDSMLVLDVRDAQAYAQERIPGAVNIPLAELPRRCQELPRDKTIVCYCWTVTCALAPKAALELAHRGYKVQELFGGIDAWKKAGMPVESGAARAQPSSRRQQ